MSYPYRPIIMGRRGVVTSGHYLATEAGYRMFQMGGNAIDAAAAMCFCEILLEPQNCGIGGEVPTLIYSAQEQKVFAVSGMGWSPSAFTVDWCKQNQIDMIPGDGYLPACVPSVVGTWTEALARFGTLSFAQILTPLIELAEGGFPVYQELRNCIQNHSNRWEEIYPSTYALYCPQNKVPEVGEFLCNPDLAKILRMMIREEAGAARKGRLAGLKAAGDVFYKGVVAERIDAFIHKNPVVDSTGKQHYGLLTYEDMAEWQAEIEEPVSYEYRGLDVYKCSSWTQGPVFLQQLAILENFDLAGMGHNTAEYLHTWIECANLAFADREAYYGDPKIDNVPFEVLLSKEYGRQRSQLIGSEACLELRPGQINHQVNEYMLVDVLADNRRALALLSADKKIDLPGNHIGDTTHLDAVDSTGNMVSSTPSGAWIPSSPVIEGLGFPLGTRGQMFYLDPRRPNALAPHKRPRATLTPSLVLKDGKPYMVFGTPGGDSQDQWTLQFFLNVVDFGMDLQKALDEPTVHSGQFPSSFYPRIATSGEVMAENRIPEDVIQSLINKGHKVSLSDSYSHGKVMGIRFHPESGLIEGAVSVKGVVGYAFGY